MSKKEKDRKEWIIPPRAAATVLVVQLAIMSSLYTIIRCGQDIKGTKDNQEYQKTATLINNEVFKEAYGSYDTYIDLIAEEINNTNMNNSSMGVFVAYTTLEKNGWISLGDKFTFGDPDFEPIGNPGISVVLGEGVCRNEAFNFFKVLDSLDYDCGIVYGELYEKLPSDGSGHAVTYVKDGKHLILYDPTNKTIFLRDVWGRFISIDNKDLKFNPSIYLDSEFNQLGDNLDVYFYIGEDYGSYITYDTRRTKAEEEVKEYYDYYQEYEQIYLLPYEEQIAEEKDKYDTIVQKILSSKNEKTIVIDID